MTNKAELLFMKWKADLAEMDRSKPMVEGNFDLLFEQLHKAKVKMEDALPYLDKATKAHYPKPNIIKHTFRKVKQFNQYENAEDFEVSWKEFIGDAAKRVFFSIYDIDGADNNKETKYGNMSASEYRKQQKYADSHPSIDWKAIIQERDAEVDDGPNINLDEVNLDIDLGEL